MLDKKSTYPAMQIARSNPAVAAALSKAETPHNRSVVYRNGERDISANTNPMLLTSVLGKRAKKNADTAAIFNLLPDLQLAKQILVSSILSPKDMTSTELIYMVPKNLFAPDLASSLISRIKDHFENDYDIIKQLPVMLEEALFDKGSYPVAVLPENAIDDFINGSTAITTESMKSRQDVLIRKSIGILGNANNDEIKDRSLAYESFSNRSLNSVDDKIIIDKKDLPILTNGEDFVLESISVTDNYSVLKLPKVNRIFDKENVRQRYSNYSRTSLESFDTVLKDIDVDKLIFRSRSHQSKLADEIKTQENLTRKSVGNPLIMKLPSESIIPIYVPGDKTDHVGYFILLDAEGNPVNSADNDLSLANMSNSSGNSLSSALIKRVESNMCDGSNCFNSNNQQHIQAAARIYADIIEKDLINRVKNGIYTSSLEIGKNEEVYRIMLSRTLAKKYTQILYIPIEYVTYIAFDYDSTGIGKSLMDDTMTVNTLRTILMFTDLMASVKNSIGRTSVAVDIPPLDVNPEQTIETIIDEVVRSRAVNLPTSVSNPSDVIEWIQRAGYEWTFTGHPKIPDLKMNFNQIQSSYQKADTDLQDNLKKSSISALGLTPEIVDNGLSNAEFATVAIANNVLLNKRVMTFQEQFTPQLSDHMRKIAMNTRSLIDDVKGIIESNFEAIQIELDDEEFDYKLEDELKRRIIVTKAINEFFSGFYVELPKPSSVTMQQQLDDFSQYSDGLDKALDAYISDTFFTDSTSGEIASDVNVLRGVIKAYFLRKFLAEKGILTELADLTSVGEDGEPLFDLPTIAASHLDALNKAGVTTLADLASKVEALNEKLNDAKDTENTNGDGDVGIDETVDTGNPDTPDNSLNDDLVV